jgi:hypothetical protein
MVGPCGHFQRYLDFPDSNFQSGLKELRESIESSPGTRLMLFPNHA